MSPTAPMAGSPIATLIAMTAPSPWPTIAVRRRSSSRRERIAPIASRASSMRVKRLEAAQSPPDSPQPRGS